MGIPSVSSARANMNFDAPKGDRGARLSCSSPSHQHCPITVTTSTAGQGATFPATPLVTQAPTGDMS